MKSLSKVNDMIYLVTVVLFFVVLMDECVFRLIVSLRILFYVIFVRSIRIRIRMLLYGVVIVIVSDFKTILNHSNVKFLSWITIHDTISLARQGHGSNIMECNRQNHLNKM